VDNDFLTQGGGDDVVTISEWRKDDPGHVRTKGMEEKVVTYERDASADDDAAWTAQGNHVAQCHSQAPPGFLQHTQGDGIPLARRGGNGLGVGGPRYLSNRPAGGAVFQDAPESAAFQLDSIEIILDPQMADLGGALTSAAMNLPVKDQRPTDAGPYSDVEDRRQPAASPEPRFRQPRHIGIIAKNRSPTEVLLRPFGEGKVAPARHLV
jgi:hypothetical protein